jgi:hypothetical protein
MRAFFRSYDLHDSFQKVGNRKGEKKFIMLHEISKQRAAKLGLRGGDLASLANISGPKLSNYFRGRVELDAAKRSEIEEVLSDLENLEKVFPISIGVHDAKLTARMLERFRTGKFEVFETLTKTIDWSEQPEGLERKFPRLFKVKKDNKKAQGASL